MTIEYVQEHFEIVNGKDYKADDNRTYIDEPLSNKPNLDIAYHIAAPVRGANASSIVTSKLGNFFGNLNEELYRKSDNRVFYFPKSSNFKDNVKTIVSISFPTLFTTWHIKRYNILSTFAYKQQTTVYYDVKSNYFFVAMDERFFDNFETSEIYYNEDHNDEKVQAKIKQTKDNKQVLIVYANTIEELKKELVDDGKTFDILHKRYKQHFLNLQDLEKVIVLRYETDNEMSMKDKNSDQFSITNNRNNNAMDFIIRQNMKMEMFQAAKTDDGLYYLIDEKTEMIQPKAIIHIDEAKTAIEYIEKEKNTKFSFQKGGSTFLIMPYNKDDWDLLKKIQDKLHSICRELESILQTSKTEVGQLDKPISSLDAISQNKTLLLK